MRRFLPAITMVMLVVLSAIFVVYAKHLNRITYVELQQLQNARDQMNVEWGQLQLEQSTFAAHSTIEKKAREQLGMVLPNTDDIVIVKP